MRTLGLSDAPLFPGAGELNARDLADDDRFGMVHFTLPPGGFISLHHMPFVVCFLILEGRGTLTLADDSRELDAGCRVHCLPATRRGWRNCSPDTDLRVLVLKIKHDRENQGEEMDIRNLSEETPAKNPHGVDVRRVYESEYALVSMITLKPEQKLIRHITPVDVFFYVVGGTGDVEIGEEIRTVGPDTVIESPKNIPHCWYNHGDEDLRVLVVKIPKPATPSRLL